MKITLNMDLCLRHTRLCVFVCASVGTHVAAYYARAVCPRAFYSQPQVRAVSIESCARAGKNWLAVLGVSSLITALEYWSILIAIIASTLFKGSVVNKESLQFRHVRTRASVCRSVGFGSETISDYEYYKSVTRHG